VALWGGGGQFNLENIDTWCRRWLGLERCGRCDHEEDLGQAGSRVLITRGGGEIRVVR
jgi:hypothetical protein